ncbi:MAG TPA: pantoate--beta-alanine ligase [Dehalococcoidia bacterium]|nr:pantoate--beta-alanine ligase [Dehalococcoidia bacterium]
MKVVDTVAAMRDARRQAKGTVGLVPTMGYLHEGHLTLVRWARRQTEVVVVSIFVNPTQFGPNEDFDRYPRDPQRDLALLEREGTDIVFMPLASEMYPQGFSSWVDVEGITDRLEGVFRPGHFRGVATVVAKLFNIVEPHRAYFGEKDAQQLRVIQKMVADLNMNLEIVPVPTVREADGLAMSSRNAYLNPQERQSALALYKSLTLAQGLYAQGERDAETIRRRMIQLIEKEPGAKIDYVSLADPDTLEELDRIEGPALASLAVRIGTTRLIDNMMLGGGN